MRIVYTHRTQGAGAEGVHIMGMVEAYREAGHEVIMDGLPGCDPFEKDKPVPVPAPGKAGDPAAAPGGSGGSGLKAAYRILSDHSPQFVFGTAELLYNAPLFFRLWKKLRQVKPDQVYERYALGNFAPALLCSLLRIPLILEVNDSVVIERSRPLSLSGVKRFLERRILASASLVITISERFKAQLLQAFPLPEAKILVCPNGVSKTRFRPIPEESIRDLKAEWKPEGRILLGSAGQFVQWHGLAAFVTAMAPMALARNLGFLFIGDGPVKNEVLEAAAACGLADRVHFTGMLPHSLIPRFLSLLDIAVIPFSNVHGSPMKLIEFLAMGLPVIAPDLPPIREVLVDGVTGRIFRVGDMEDMGRRLAEMLDDREASRAMAERGRAHALANLTWAGHVGKIGIACTSSR